MGCNCSVSSVDSSCAVFFFQSCESSHFFNWPVVFSWQITWAKPWRHWSSRQRTVHQTVWIVAWTACSKLWPITVSMSGPLYYSSLYYTVSQSSWMSLCNICIRLFHFIYLAYSDWTWHKGFAASTIWMTWQFGYSVLLFEKCVTWISFSLMAKSLAVFFLNVRVTNFPQIFCSWYNSADESSVWNRLVARINIIAERCWLFAV